jgi:putative NADH-flavin reductase
MKLAVYGATGMVGREVVNEARTRGHAVTRITRSGSDGTVAADLGDVEAFRKIASDHDAVVIAIPPDRKGGPHEPYLAAADAIIAANPKARVLWVGGAGSLLADGKPLLDSPGFPEAYKPEARTMMQVLEKLRTRGSALNWTFLCPAPAISPGQRTGQYKVALDTPAGQAISSQDFAVAVVDELEKPGHERERFTVAN